MEFPHTLIQLLSLNSTLHKSLSSFIQDLRYSTIFGIILVTIEFNEAGDLISTLDAVRLRKL
jgi:hypothetical protein